jgi:hypothetical protein
MFSVLQNASSKIATSSGVSNHTYGGRKRTNRCLLPVQGSGQGNGAGPGSFFTESCALIGYMKRGFSTFTTACISLIQIFCYCFLFVDDKNQQHVAESTSTTGEQMAELAQSSLTYWVGLLGATGGAINPSKSSWYLLGFEWTGSAWVYRLQKDMPGSLSAIDLNGVVTQLHRLDPHESSKQFGVYLAADGNMAAETEYLTGSTSEWTRNLVTNNILDKNEVWRNYTHTITKTMQYAMSGTTIDEPTWDAINSKPRCASLSRSAAVRTFAKELVYGPLQYQGLGAPKPWYT